MSKAFLEIFCSGVFWFNYIVIREHSLYNLTRFKLFEACFVAQDVVYLGRCFVFTRKKYVFYCCWTHFPLSVGSSFLRMLFNFFFHVLCSFSICLVYQLLRKGYWNISLIYLFKSTSFCFTYYTAIIRCVNV